MQRITSTLQRLNLAVRIGGGLGQLGPSGLGCRLATDLGNRGAVKGVAGGDPSDSEPPEFHWLAAGGSLTLDHQHPLIADGHEESDGETTRLTEAAPISMHDPPTKQRRPPQMSLSFMLLMMVIFSMMSAGLFYASRVPAVQEEINVMVHGRAGGDREDVGRLAHITFIMFTFTSPLILAGVLSTGMAVLAMAAASRMSKSRAKARTAKMLSDDQIVDVLGDVALPGEVRGIRCRVVAAKAKCDSASTRNPGRDLPLPTTPVPWYALGHRPMVESPKPSRFLCYAAGDYYVQDAGSLLALAALGADTSALRGQLICDLCAAPGGKASALVEAIEAGRQDGAGFVLANEVIRSRIGALQMNLARTGSDRFAVSNLDPDALADRLSGVFDIVVVDAPCSGQAMVGRGTQKVSALSKNQIQHSALSAKSYSATPRFACFVTAESSCTVPARSPKPRTKRRWSG